MRRAALLMLLVVCIGLLLVAATPSAAATINVPADYGTIQAAVTAAVAGDTVSVSGGPYTEAVTINNLGHSRDGITIQGSGVTLNGGFLIQTSNGRGSDNVTIDGFTIVGGAFSGSMKNGVRVSASGCTIKNCTIQNVIGNQCWAIETVGGSNNLLVQENTISGNQAGIYLNPCSGTVIRGNTISGNNGDGSAASGKIGLGTDTVSNLTIEGNTISGHELEGMGAYQVGTHTIRYNNFVDNNSAITWYAGGDITAQQNWWGNANGPADPNGTLEVPENPAATTLQMLNAAPAGDLGNPVCDGVAWVPVPGTDHINYFPFAGAAIGPFPPNVVWVDDDWTGPGNCGGHIWGYDAFAVIQQGVNAVAAGGTVNVAAGTYNLAGMGGSVWEPVAINKSLSLIGAGSTQTILDATGYTGHCDVVALRGSNVQLQGLGVRNGSYGIRIAGPAGQHDLQLDDVAVSGNVASGIVFDLFNGSADVTNVALTDCSASNNGVGGDGRGIYVAPGKPVTNLSLTDTDCCANSRDGLHVQGTLIGLTIDGGKFNDNTGTTSYYGSGITLERTTNGAISGVEAKRNGSVYPSHGIYVKTVSSNVAISNCDLGNERYGVLFISCTDCSTEGNNIANCDYGIADFYGVRSEHADNSITGTGLMGMQLRLAGDGVPGQWGTGDLDIGSSTFGSNLTEFIRLTSGGGTIAAVDVDATSATFQGAADDAAREAKVWHDVDDATLGHVDWGQGAATTTNLSVQNVSGATGATVQLAARLTAGGSALAGQAVNISVNGTLIGSPVTDTNGWARINYTITQNAGSFNIDAAFGGVSNYKAATGRGTLTVTTPAPTSITVTMAPNPVTAGQTSTATVMGNNGVDYSTGATCYIQYGAGGSWAGNVYTSAKAGTWTVTAVYGSLAATTTLTVNHGAASSVTLAPATATITTDQTQTYTVQATDAQGNSWTPAAVEILWTENGAGGFTGMVYTPTVADGGNVVTVTATVDGVASNAAALTVISSGSGGTPLILAWDKDTATFYLCSDAANPQTGTALALGNNTVGGITVSVTKVGSSSTDLIATVTNAGAPTNSLQVRWYLRSGAVDKCYSYSTISGTTHTAVYSLGRTAIDGGRSQVGFFGLAHNLNADPPTGITYSVVQQ